MNNIAKIMNEYYLARLLARDGIVKTREIQSELTDCKIELNDANVRSSKYSEVLQEIATSDCKNKRDFDALVELAKSVLAECSGGDEGKDK